MTVWILDGFAEWAGYFPPISFSTGRVYPLDDLLPNGPAAVNSACSIRSSQAARLFKKRLIGIFRVWLVVSACASLA